MSQYLSCDAASALIEPFIDGELTVEAQVALESHLRWCRVCEARVDDLQLIGAALHVRHRVVAQDAVSVRDLATMRSSVLERVRAEREQSFLVRTRQALAARRLLWPAVGATLAVVFCVGLASRVLTAVTALNEPESLASMIDMLANPGSDQNPLVLDGRVSLPRALEPDLVLGSVMEEDVAFAVSAVVTREGRVSNYELLLSERASGRRHQSAAEQDVDAPAVMDAVKRSRFTPAQGAEGPVAVNVVWLVTRTTVKPAAAPASSRKPAHQEAPAVDIPPASIEGATPDLQDVPATTPSTTA